MSGCPERCETIHNPAPTKTYRKAATYLTELKRDKMPAPETNQPQASRPIKRVDWASAALAVIGLLSTALAYMLITYAGHNPLTLAPGIVATTLGCTKLIVKEAPRFTQQTRTPAATREPRK